MRPAYYVIPLALITAPTAVYASIYLTVDEAQQKMFPGQTLTKDFRTLTGDQIKAIRKDSGQSPLSDTLNLWRVEGGGWFIVDKVIGKHEFITYAVGLDVNGAVKDIEVLEYNEAYGGQVRDAGWLQQFFGKTDEAKLKLGRDVKNISGATLSCKHITDGMRRILATYQVVIAHG
jgi:hypothetical protein